MEETGIVVPCRQRLEERIDLAVIEEKRRPGGLSVSILVSIVFHAALIAWFLLSYKPMARVAKQVPIARYVELMKQNPQDKQFVEAPGPKIEHAPSPDAPLSNANRKASAPQSTGTTPTKRPGDGSGLFTPPMGQQRQQQQQQQAMSAPPMPQTMPAPTRPAQNTASETFAYREPAQTNQNPAVDWRNAIRDVRKVASLGGAQNMDLGNLGPGGGGGGEKGFVEQGPLSFETQWYDWGDYAASMVSRIRVNWYANMPQLIRTGLKAAVTIRFTIQRDGRITDVTVLQSSGVPPYDYAAKKAIELSSPLNALPKDFPNASERVTCMFYYNMEVPSR